jgi:hypothetical protein
MANFLVPGINTTQSALLSRSGGMFSGMTTGQKNQQEKNDPFQSQLTVAFNPVGGDGLPPLCPLNAAARASICPTTLILLLVQV